MKDFPLDPNVEILKWGPTPIYPLLRYQTCVSGFFNCFPKIYPGYSWPKALLVSNKNSFIWMHEHDELRKNGARVFLDFILSDRKRELVRLNWEKSVNELHLLEEKIEDDLSSLSDSDLSNIWTEFHRLTDIFWSHSGLPELSNYGSAELLEVKLKGVIPDDKIGMALEILCAPEEMSFYQKEEIDLLESDNIEDHQKKYFWLKNSYANIEVLSVDFFKKRKKEIPLDFKERVDKRLSEVKREKNLLQKKYKIPQDYRDMGDAIGNCIVWQDERKKEIWIYLYYENVLLQEMAKRRNLDENLLVFGTHEEIFKIFSGEMLIDKLIPRLDSTGIYADDNKVEVLEPQKSLFYWDTYVEVKEGLGVDEFKGVIASKGKARAKIKIILDPHGDIDFEEGDILVTTMTTPEFVFIMKKSSAVITDHGGITSHAAIVSRELGKPCIIGTKIATKVLKDGDEVEVDADNGVVRIIKRKN
jgi:phosphoenolpyruvate synthase/pyruvate phosphate dikinase